jgi:hypothetical protein
MVGTLFAVSTWLIMARLTPDALASRSREKPLRVRKRRKLRPSNSGRSFVRPARELGMAVAGSAPSRRARRGCSDMAAVL